MTIALIYQHFPPKDTRSYVHLLLHHSTHLPLCICEEYQRDSVVSRMTEKLVTPSSSAPAADVGYNTREKASTTSHLVMGTL